MLKTYIAIGSLWALSFGATAGMIERDWVAEGDKCLTYVSELNIEILDVSFTSNIGHIAAANELVDGGLFAGFRFIRFDEINAIIDTYFGGMDSQFKVIQAGSEVATQVSNFLELIDASLNPFGRSVTFNSCEIASGCTLGIPVDSSHHLHNSQRWNFTTGSIYMVDQLDNPTQLLIRDVKSAAVPEPAGGLLLGVGLMLVAWLRYRSNN